MPWINKYIEPDLAFKCHKWTKMKGAQYAQVHFIEVYHAYKNNDYHNRLQYWYTLHNGVGLDVETWDISHLEFDIRDLPTFDESLTHQEILQQAIDNNLCTIEDVFIHIQKAHHVSHDQ